MKILKTLLVVLLTSSITPSLIAQCNLSTSPTVTSVLCGAELDISAIGLSPTPALATDFNGGTLGPGWSTSVNAQYSNPCGPTLDGTPALWFGNVGAPRTLTTNAFDVSCGGEVCFDFDMATQGGSAPCEGPDVITEGVYFQYSIDGGATWIDIFYFQPNAGGTTGPYLNWANYCFLIPPGAQTTSTMFQWDQQVVSGAGFDHWGVDNITIYPSDCNFWYDWDHVPGFPDNADQTVMTDTDTTFYVTYTDGTTFCYDSVIVNVDPIEITVSDPNPVCGSLISLSIADTNPSFWADWDHVPGFPDSTFQTVSPGTDSSYYVTYTNGTLVCSDTADIVITPIIIDIVGNPNPVDCGSCSDLSVDFLNGNSGSIEDDFEGGADPLTWSDIQSGTATATCNIGGTGDALYFNGTGANRYAETVAIDATTCGNIDFCLFMGNTASFPCENNELGDDIVLEYSIDGGVTFTPIATYLESLWDGTGNNTQQCFSEVMPLAAQTTSTIFRWRQLAFFPSTNNSDNWSLDDVLISCNPPTITYNWTTGTVDDNTSPTPIACPATDELYTVTMMNSLTGCEAMDTSTLFVNECECFFMQFDGNVVCQPGGVFDVTGSFEYSYSPTTGTIEVEATNTTGTYSQSFTPPFTDSTVFNYTISGIPNDGTTTTMYIYFTDSLSCNQTFDITPPVLPTVTGISGGDTYCAGDTVTPISVDVTGTGPWTVSYTLNGTPTTVTSATSPVVLGTAEGTYVLTEVEDQVCLNVAAGTDAIVVNPLPAISAGADQALCDGQTTQLSGTGGVAYSWSNGVVNGTTFTPPVGTTTYDVTGADANGCQNTSSMTIVVTAYPPAPGVGPQGGDYCASSTEIPPFTATGGGQVFTWYTDATLTNSLTTGPNLQPLIIEGTTNYFVTQSVNGCEGPASSVDIFLENCEATIVMPNVFTPNTDGTNALFHPVYMDGVTTAETFILNRWGNVIFQTGDQDVNWDGLNAKTGKAVEEGTYFWKMVYTDLNGDEFVIHGNVQVIR